MDPVERKIPEEKWGNRISSTWNKQKRWGWRQKQIKIIGLFPRSWITCFLFRCGFRLGGQGNHLEKVPGFPLELHLWHLSSLKLYTYPRLYLPFPPGRFPNLYSSPNPLLSPRSWGDDLYLDIYEHPNCYLHLHNSTPSPVRSVSVKGTTWWMILGKSLNIIPHYSFVSKMKNICYMTVKLKSQLSE